MHHLDMGVNCMKKIICTIFSNMILRDCNANNVKANVTVFRQFPYEIQVIAENLYVL
jgi:hypothetical protein